ncbi:class I SAM-dependent methyltransferase [Salegentibacter sediminis]|uniref:class I SAM-dependent methyltransferase n=1 Tax=Salegentibacter sediminis TaxID=1930251 RepID=UPI0009BFFA67|nr:class I SAM-dependent methyltransferase [Salegentibacter sediminis]
MECRDFLVSKEKFQLLPVVDFEILKTSPVPQNLAPYYESENYISHTDSSKGITNKVYQLVKNYMLDQKLNWIEALKSPGKLLDVGAGTGDFILSAKKRGWQVSGVEPNKSARELAIHKNLELKEGLSKFDGEKFDVICLWHVLEHIPDLEKEISRLKAMLKKNGILVIAVPNFKSYDAKYYREFWAAYDVPRHIWHFSQNGIKKLFSKFDFDLIDTRALIFDAYYVSLLSEKNKTGSSNLVNAFYRGWKSNRQAKYDSEYSSLVYFFQK